MEVKGETIMAPVWISPFCMFSLFPRLKSWETRRSVTYEGVIFESFNPDGLPSGTYARRVDLAVASHVMNDGSLSLEFPDWGSLSDRFGISLGGVTRRQFPARMRGYANTGLMARSPTTMVTSRVSLHEGRQGILSVEIDEDFASIIKEYSLPLEREIVDEIISKPFAFDTYAAISVAARQNDGSAFLPWPDFQSLLLAGRTEGKSLVSLYQMRAKARETAELINSISDTMMVMPTRDGLEINKQGEL